MMQMTHKFGKVGRSDSTDYEKMYASHGWQVINVDGLIEIKLEQLLDKLK